MSQFREYDEKDKKRDVTFQDKRIIEKLLVSDKLTEEEKMALDHLLYSYNYVID